MKDMAPLPGIYDPDFIAANQDMRADNIIKGSRQQQLEHIRQDIRDFHQRTGVDKVVILWTANTERYSDVSASPPLAFLKHQALPSSVLMSEDRSATSDKCNGTLE